MNDKLFLSLENLTVRHLNQVLFKNLTFQVNQGEHWALLGESGSGKSALLQTIAGRFGITAGHINYNFYKQYVSEHTIDDPLFTFHKLIASVQQKHHFRNLSNTTEFYYQQRYNSFDSEDALTVNDYLKDIQSKTVENPVWSYRYTVERLQLKKLLDKQLIKLSNGETRRLMIAAALLRHPLLLLLDSPFTGLDAASRPLLNEIISEIARSGITVIMTTSPSEIPDAITHTAILDQGKIEAALPKDEFNPEMLHLQPSFELNENELKALLELKPRENFETIVKMENVSVRYNERQILNSINWEIKSGECWSLTGPNGVGKSTLLSLLTGDNPQAYANNIILFDKKRGSGESIWDIKKKIGFVSPELLQYFKTGSTCLQVVESGCYDTMGLFRKSDEANAALAERWMKVFQISENSREPFRNVPASTQRLCLLARALIKNPPLLILDEPFQGLDPGQQEYFKNLIDRICTLSRTSLIFVSHYKEEIPDCVTKHMELKSAAAD